MNEQQVFFVLVNYNALDHTLECIESIKSISYKNCSIVVVDNDSKEKSIYEIKLKYKDVHIIVNDKNYGFSKANNIGIKYALDRGADFVCLLNNDTVIEKECLTILIKAYQSQREKIGIVTGKIINYYDRKTIWYAGGDLSNVKGDAISYGFGKRDFSYVDQNKICSFASGCFMLIPREVVKKYPLSEQYFLYYEDVEYCHKLYSDGYKVLYIPTAIIYHKESISTGKKSSLFSYYYTRNRLYYISQNIGSPIRIVAYILTYLTFIKRCLEGNLQVHSCLKGIGDFYIGNVGQCEQNI